jgi:hypothetical protein
MKDLVFALGDFLTETFKILPKLGNLPNIIFIIIGFILLIYWLRAMTNYNREAEENGTLK